MYQELTIEQRRVLVDTLQVWPALDEARRAAGEHQGTLRWKQVGGHEYLTRRRGATEISLGPRGEETEAAYEAWQRNRERYRSLQARVKEQARFARAARINRVPMEVAQLCRQLAHRDHWCLAGTNCLYAYEARAGVRITSGAEATQDADILWDGRSAALVAEGLEGAGLIGLLQRIDGTFQRVERQPFRASNDKGFMVDLIRPFDGSGLTDADRSASDTPGDLVAQPIEGLEWLVASPVLRDVAVDARGEPFQMPVPDPRAFAVHKLWLSQRADREPVKRRRDRDQALLVAHLLHEHLPDLPLAEEHLQQFPANVRAAGIRGLTVLDPP